MKRTICIFLSAMILFAATIPVSAAHLWPTDPEDPVSAITCDQAIAEYEEKNQTTVETRRYYFQMPDGIHGFCDEEGKVAPSWYNEFSQGTGVYWWSDAPAACEAWPGYRAMVAERGEHIYYVNMPAEVSHLIWNNGVDTVAGDTENPAYGKMYCTLDVSCEYADPGELDTMPEGCDSFDGCIYIIKPKVPSTAPLDSIWMSTAGGEWYFYYGDGCYGMYDEDSANFKSVDVNCCNPDHFDADGRHIGYIPDNALRGDYDKDGELSILDATCVQRMLAGVTTSHSDEFLTLVDADGDKKLTILDATCIQRVLAGLITIDTN